MPNRNGALFRLMSNKRTGKLDDILASDGVYKFARRYAPAHDLKIGAHKPRATVAAHAFNL